MRGRSRSSLAASTEDPSGRLTRRYIAALLAVALFSALNPLLLQPALSRLATDAPLINVAGRQRMLSQRLAKASLRFDRASDLRDRRFSQDELKQVLSVWTRSHDALRHGEGARSVPSAPRTAVQAAFDGLEPSYVRLRDAAIRLAGGDGSSGEELATILAQEPEYLERMDRIVEILEHQARDKVRWLAWFGWFLICVILAGLAAIGMLILWPASRLIRRQVAELNAAREVLEVRINERTRELESEVRERYRTEERHRALLEQMSHAGRTSTIGEMATGLAHELNQPLGAIANYAEGCLVALESPGSNPDDLRDVLQRILATTLRAGEIVNRIRRFVTRHEPVRDLVAPNPLVAETAEFVRDQARRLGITLSTRLAPDLPKFRGDPVQIQQVLVNLVRNAFESLSDSKPQEPSVVMETARTSSGGIEFTVSDNGEGVRDDRVARLFDAFFSTRDEGMGMGLAISRTIVESHHGTIGVESLPGVRTTFRFTLPPAGDDDAGADRLPRG